MRGQGCRAQGSGQACEEPGPGACREVEAEAQPVEGVPGRRPVCTGRTCVLGGRGAAGGLPAGVQSWSRSFPRYRAGSRVTAQLPAPVPAPEGRLGRQGDPGAQVWAELRVPSASVIPGPVPSAQVGVAFCLRDDVAETRVPGFP